MYPSVPLRASKLILLIHGMFVKNCYFTVIEFC